MTTRPFADNPTAEEDQLHNAPYDDLKTAQQYICELPGLTLDVTLCRYVAVEQDEEFQRALDQILACPYDDIKQALSSMLDAYEGLIAT